MSMNDDAATPRPFRTEAEYRAAMRELDREVTRAAVSAARYLVDIETGRIPADRERVRAARAILARVRPRSSSGPDDAPPAPMLHSAYE